MERRILRVSSRGGQQFSTISEAIKDAVDGDAIVVYAGHYDEKVVLDKALDVYADDSSEPSEVVVTAGFIASSAGGHVQRLNIQQGVEIRSGSCRFTNCEISEGSDSVRILAGSDCTLAKCRIHAAQNGGDGVYFAEGAKGTIEDCEIFANRVNGVHVNGANATIRRCKIHHCPYGIFFRKAAKGLAEYNEIENVQCFGLYVMSNSEPILTRNTVSSCGIHAVMISSGGAGSVKDNSINGSVRILRGCNPTLGVNTVAGRIDNENLLPPGVSQ